ICRGDLCDLSVRADNHREASHQWMNATAGVSNFTVNADRRGAYDLRHRPEWPSPAILGSRIQSVLRTLFSWSHVPMKPTMTLSTTLAALALVMSAASPARLAAQNAPAAGPRTIEIKASDAMKYDVTTIQAKPGELLRVRLSAAGTIPKMVMSHNFVLLKKGSNPQTFAEKSATANTTGYIA